jgi:hypothetical protein
MKTSVLFISMALGGLAACSKVTPVDRDAQNVVADADTRIVDPEAPNNNGPPGASVIRSNATRPQSDPSTDNEASQPAKLQ